MKLTHSLNLIIDGASSISTHDRYFLENVAQWILELDRGQGIPFEGKNNGVLSYVINLAALKFNSDL